MEAIEGYHFYRDLSSLVSNRKRLLSFLQGHTAISNSTCVQRRFRRDSGMISLPPFRMGEQYPHHEQTCDADPVSVIARGVTKPIAPFDHLDQVLSKACRGRPINKIVIEVKRDTENLARLDIAINEHGPIGNPSDDHAKGMQARQPDAPASPVGEHANGCDPDGADDVFEQARVFEQKPEAEQPGKGR